MTYLKEAWSNGFDYDDDDSPADYGYKKEHFDELEDRFQHMSI